MRIYSFIRVFNIIWALPSHRNWNLLIDKGLVYKIKFIYFLYKISNIAHLITYVGLKHS